MKFELLAALTRLYEKRPKTESRSRMLWSTRPSIVLVTPMVGLVLLQLPACRVAGPELAKGKKKFCALSATGLMRLAGMVLLGKFWPVVGSFTAEGKTPLRHAASGVLPVTMPWP